MKKIGLGIAILLFAIIISLCSSGMGLLVIGIGIVGLIFSIIGFMERKYNNFKFGEWRTSRSCAQIRAGSLAGGMPVW